MHEAMSNDLNVESMDPTDVLHKLLGARIKCTLDDGRSATGRFICVDRLMNIILTDAVEERMISTSDYSDSTNATLPAVRKLGQALIPGERLTKVEIEKSLLDTRIQTST